MNRRTLLTFLLPLTATGCFFGRTVVNEPLDAAAVARLEPGATTAAQAVDLLGAPSDVVQLGKRFAYRYDHSVDKFAATWLLLFAVYNNDLRQDRAWLFFDENAVLTHAGTTLAAHRGQYAFPWEDVHEAADHAARDASRFGAR